jgi:hypothetical protein
MQSADDQSVFVANAGPYRSLPMQWSIATDIYRVANGRIAENWHFEVTTSSPATIICSISQLRSGTGVGGHSTVAPDCRCMQY